MGAFRRAIFQAQRYRQRADQANGPLNSNGIAIGLALVGGLTIPSGIALNATTPFERPWAAALSLSSLGVSPYIHIDARRWLGRFGPMIDWIYDTLAVVALPVGAIALTRFAGWSLDRDLARSRRERLARLDAS